jgi:hypothetical protein
MNSKTVTIVADGVCTIKGTSALKLQEAEGVKAKKTDGPSPAGREGQGASSASREAGKSHSEGSAKTLQEGSEWVVIKAVDANGKSIAYRSFRLTTPSGTVVEGQTPLDGIVSVNGIARGDCKVEWLDEDPSSVKKK